MYKMHFNKSEYLRVGVEYQYFSQPPCIILKNENSPRTLHRILEGKGTAEIEHLAQYFFICLSLSDPIKASSGAVVNFSCLCLLVRSPWKQNLRMMTKSLI